jgi:hypothetical protein
MGSFRVLSASCPGRARSGIAWVSGWWTGISTSRLGGAGRTAGGPGAWAVGPHDCTPPVVRVGAVCLPAGEPVSAGPLNSCGLACCLRARFAKVSIGRLRSGCSSGR